MSSRGTDSTVPVEIVRASEGKAARAEPISLFYRPGPGLPCRPLLPIWKKKCATTRAGRSSLPTVWMRWYGHSTSC